MGNNETSCIVKTRDQEITDLIGILFILPFFFHGFYLSSDELHTYIPITHQFARYDIEREKNSRDMNVTFRQYRVSRAIGRGKIQLPLFRGDTVVFVVE